MREARDDGCGGERAEDAERGDGDECAAQPPPADVEAASKRMTTSAITPIRSTVRMARCSLISGKRSDAAAAASRKSAGAGTGKRSESLLVSTAARNDPESSSTTNPNRATSSTGGGNLLLGGPAPALHFPYVRLKLATTRPRILRIAMRRALCFGLLIGLLVPAGALAERTVPGDGTLAVRNGDGMLRIDLRGVALGRMGSGVLEVEVPLDRDCDGRDVSVVGAERQREDVKWVDDETPVWLCRFVDRRGGLRFRIKGQQVIRFKFMRHIFIRPSADYERTKSTLPHCRRSTIICVEWPFGFDRQFFS